MNRNNNSYFQNYIVPLGHLPQRGFRASEHLLRKAFEWFDKRIQEHIKATPNEAGEAVARLIEGISDKLFFTVITVTDQLNAFKVFETLNARGVRLSATDLLKNYLFSVLHRERDDAHELSVLEDRWERMVGRLGSEFSRLPAQPLEQPQALRATGRAVQDRTRRGQHAGSGVRPVARHGARPRHLSRPVAAGSGRLAARLAGERPHLAHLQRAPAVFRC